MGHQVLLLLVHPPPQTLISIPKHGLVDVDDALPTVQGLDELGCSQLPLQLGRGGILNRPDGLDPPVRDAQLLAEILPQPWTADPQVAGTHHLGLDLPQIERRPRLRNHRPDALAGPLMHLLELDPPHLPQQGVLDVREGNASEELHSTQAQTQSLSDSLHWDLALLHQVEGLLRLRSSPLSQPPLP